MACETEKLAFDIIYYNLGKRPASQNDDDVVRWEIIYIFLGECLSESGAPTLQLFVFPVS